MIVAILRVDVNVEIAHDGLERKLAHRGAKHRLGRLAQGEIARMPSHAQSLGVRVGGTAERTHQSPPTVLMMSTLSTTIAPITTIGAIPNRLPFFLAGVVGKLPGARLPGAVGG